MNDTLLINESNLLDEIQGHPFVGLVGMVVFFIYGVSFLFGVPANVYVLCRLRKLARDDKEKYRNGTGSGLFAMATTDLLSLFAILISIIHAGISFDVDDWIASLLCKALLFTTHTVTSISIWCWLLMSTLRYLAIRHPLFHLRLWRAPNRAITLITLLSSITNIWILIAVDRREPSGCAQYPIDSDGRLNGWLHLIECFWSFCLPVAAIIYMDAMILVCRPLQFQAKHDGSKSVQNARIRKKAKAALWKWLTIAFIDILLNTPENLYRLLVLCGMPAAINDIYSYSARMVAQVLYHSQFAFNAVYLAVFIYDKNISPRRISTPTRSYASVDMKLASRQGSSSFECPRGERRHQSQREMRKMAMDEFRQRSNTDVDTVRGSSEQPAISHSEIEINFITSI